MGWGKPLPGWQYPSAVFVVMNGLEDSTRTHIANARIRPNAPPDYDYDARLITVRRVGGGPDEDEDTDYPVLQIACYASTYITAANMQQDVADEVESWPMTMIDASSREEGQTPWPVLVDEAGIYVGEQEIPDVYPDERRVVATYRLGLRRQFRP